MGRGELTCTEPALLLAAGFAEKARMCGSPRGGGTRSRVRTTRRFGLRWGGVVANWPLVKTSLAGFETTTGAILPTLEPGAYSVVDRGKGSATGGALVEDYAEP